MVQFAGAKSNGTSKLLMNQDQQAPQQGALCIRCGGQEHVGQHLGPAAEHRPTAGCALLLEVMS